jgi:hypothetical protein
VAKITDPDDLVRNTHVVYDTGTKRIEVIATGALDAKDGVTLKCLYSFTKEEWKNDATLIPHPFPFTPITDEQFELIEGWDWEDDSSRFLIRDGGWTVVDPVTGNPFSKWTGIISLGTIETDDQPYYQQTSGGVATDFETTGIINQAIQIYRDDDADLNLAEGSDYDRSGFLALFTREQGQIYGKSTLPDIGVTELANQAYRFPLATATDLNVEELDANIASNSPYTQILIRYFSAAYSRPVDSATLRDFGIVVDVGTHSGIDGSAPGGGKVLTTAEGGIITAGDPFVGGTLTIHNGANAGSYLIDAATATTVTLDAGEPDLAAQSDMDFVLQRAAPVVATKQEIYEKIQYLLRQDADIDSTSGSVIGETADEIGEFVGSTLNMGSGIPSNPNGGGSGVIIEGFDANDTNDLTFTDNGAVVRTFPFVAAGTINFNPNLDNDADSAYWMFFAYTERFTNAGFAIGSTSGQNAVLTSTITDLVAELTSGDYIRLDGFDGDLGNNGIWVLTGSPAGTGPWTVAMTKVDLLTPADEAQGDTVSLDKNPIDSPDAIIVDDNSGTDITGLVPGPSVGFDFDYDNNVQGGRTAATNAAIVIRAIGLNTAQFVETTGTIIRATGQTFSLVAPLERNYANL